jgi:hypothetical protein
MPYKSGKMKGQLTNAEIKKLIRGHNKLVDIKIPTGATRETLLKLVSSNGYKLDHKKEALVPKVAMKRKPKVTLNRAKELTKPKPASPKTKARRQKAKQKKAVESAVKIKKIIKYKEKGDKDDKKRVLDKGEVQARWSNIQADYDMDAGDKNKVDNIVAQNDRIVKFKVADGRYLKIKYGDKVHLQIDITKK